jgi:hypothetical protein
MSLQISKKIRVFNFQETQATLHNDLPVIVCLDRIDVGLYPLQGFPAAFRIDVYDHSALLQEYPGRVLSKVLAVIKCG